MTNPTRRRFLETAAGFLAASLTSAVAGAHSKKRRRRKPIFHMYRWSGQGRRVSQAALSHAANRRYLTVGAALRDRPHRRARLRLVQIDTSLPEIFRLFVRRRRLWVDLRHVA